MKAVGAFDALYKLKKARKKFKISITADFYGIRLSPTVFRGL